jgi:hypothetical protein
MKKECKIILDHKIGFEKPKFSIKVIYRYGYHICFEIIFELEETTSCCLKNEVWAILKYTFKDYGDITLGQEDWCFGYCPLSGGYFAL